MRKTEQKPISFWKMMAVVVFLSLIPAVTFGKDEISSENLRLLKQLDREIKNKERYWEARLASADSLRKIVMNSVGEAAHGCHP